MIEDDFSDLIGEVPPPTEKPKSPLTHGGKRPRAGGKSKVVRDATEEHHIKYTKSRADHEAFKAANARLDYEVKIGKYVLREDVRTSLSVVFAAISQNLRSIPDNLERRIGLSPEAISHVSIEIDEIMDNLADELESLNRESALEKSEAENKEIAEGDDV